MELRLVDMDGEYERIKSGLYFDSDLKPYRKEFLEVLLAFFQEKERYDECIVIRDVIKNRFNHDDTSNFRDF